VGLEGAGDARHGDDVDADAQDHGLEE
jgi:hypothetical protein